MKKRLYSALLNIIISFLFIFLFNIVFSNINLYIGVNPFSVALISLLGVPGIVPIVLAAVLF